MNLGRRGWKSSDRDYDNRVRDVLVWSVGCKIIPEEHDHVRDTSFKEQELFTLFNFPGENEDLIDKV